MRASPGDQSTRPPECGVWSAECGIAMKGRSLHDLTFTLRVPHSAFHTSSPQPLLHQLADHVLDREVNLLNARRVVRPDHERDVGERLQLAAPLAQERAYGHVRRLP